MLSKPKNKQITGRFEITAKTKTIKGFANSVICHLPRIQLNRKLEFVLPSFLSIFNECPVHHSMHSRIIICFLMPKAAGVSWVRRLHLQWQDKYLNTLISQSSLVVEILLPAGEFQNHGRVGVWLRCPRSYIIILHASHSVREGSGGRGSKKPYYCICQSHSHWSPPKTMQHLILKLYFKTFFWAVFFPLYKVNVLLPLQAKG